MGAVRNTLLILGLTVLVGCSILNNGTFTSNGQFVPKKDRFRLKDKPGFVLQTSLDTINIYKFTEMYHKGVQVFPENKEYKNNASYSELHATKVYLKFYSNGRCAHISIPSTNELGKENYLKQEDLNTENSYFQKCYYYSTSQENIEIESFVYAEGYGKYIVLEYILNEDGKQLTMIHNKTKIIYTRQFVDTAWRTFKVNW